MQGINATLIVQAINFGIAYLILRKLVFAPGISLVLEERAHEARLNNEVSLATEYTQSEQERLAAEWAAEQKKLVMHIPVLPEELFVLRHIKPEIPIEALPTEHDMVEIKKSLVKALVYSVEAKR
jgi:hypothetical protein